MWFYVIFLCFQSQILKVYKKQLNISLWLIIFMYKHANWILSKQQKKAVKRGSRMVSKSFRKKKEKSENIAVNTTKISAWIWKTRASWV